MKFCENYNGIKFDYPSETAIIYEAVRSYSESVSRTATEKEKYILQEFLELMSVVDSERLTNVTLRKLHKMDK